jgi:hypothetical protein
MSHEMGVESGGEKVDEESNRGKLSHGDTLLKISIQRKEWELNSPRGPLGAAVSPPRVTFPP